MVDYRVRSLEPADQGCLAPLYQNFPEIGPAGKIHDANQGINHWIDNLTFHLFLNLPPPSSIVFQTDTRSES